MDNKSFLKVMELCDGNLQQIFCILTVAIGKKNVTEFSEYFSDSESDGIPLVDKIAVFVTTNSDALHKAGFVCQSRVAPQDGGTFVLLYIALKQKHLDYALKFDSIVEKSDNNGNYLSNKDRWNIFGRIFGFPHTAVKGFLKNQRMEYDKIRKIKPNSLYVRTFGDWHPPFVLSHKNWRQELRHLDYWTFLALQKFPYVFEYLKAVKNK